MLALTVNVSLHINCGMKQILYLIVLSLSMMLRRVRRSGRYTLTLARISSMKNSDGYTSGTGSEGAWVCAMCSQGNMWTGTSWAIGLDNPVELIWENVSCDWGPQVTTTERMLKKQAPPSFLSNLKVTFGEVTADLAQIKNETWCYYFIDRRSRSIEISNKISLFSCKLSIR